MQGETQRIIAWMTILWFPVALTVAARHVEAKNPVPEAARVHEFGIVRVAEEVRHTFQVRNRTRHALRILGVTGASATFHVLSYPESIPSGEIGKVEVRWIPREPGKALHSVLLQTERDGEKRALRLHMRGEATGRSTEIRSPLLCSEVPPNWLTRVLHRPDPALFVSVQWLKRQLDEGQSLHVVDVRSPEKHDLPTIPGAIQVPLFSLKSKEFLKTRPMVLVGEGYDLSKLEPVCEKLRELGFTAWILEGGVVSWNALGLPLQGGGVERRLFPTISPREFFEHRHLENWVFISVCRSRRQEAVCLIPQAVPLPHPESTHDVAAQVKALIKDNVITANDSMLIVDDDGALSTAILSELQKAGFRNVYVLDGGIAAYAAFMEGQIALSRSGERFEKRMGAKCPTCPEEP